VRCYQVLVTARAKKLQTVAEGPTGGWDGVVCHVLDAAVRWRGRGGGGCHRTRGDKGPRHSCSRTLQPACPPARPPARRAEPAVPGMRQACRLQVLPVPKGILLRGCMPEESVAGAQADVQASVSSQGEPSQAIPSTDTLH
jgi:hypothetical protein